MLTISSINVKGFIHGFHRYANTLSFSGFGTKLVAFMVISVLIFSFYLHFLKLLFISFLFFFSFTILHQTISICLGRYTDLPGFIQRLKGDLHRAGRRSGRDRLGFFHSSILHSPHFLLLLFLNAFLSLSILSVPACGT